MTCKRCGGEFFARWEVKQLNGHLIHMECLLQMVRWYTNMPEGRLKVGRNPTVLHLP